MPFGAGLHNMLTLRENRRIAEGLFKNDSPEDNATSCSKQQCIIMEAKVLDVIARNPELGRSGRSNPKERNEIAILTLAITGWVEADCLTEPALRKSNVFAMRREGRAWRKLQIID